MGCDAEQRRNRALRSGQSSTGFDADYYGHRYGRVRWVAVVPEYQGRGLSKCLMSIILGRMIDNSGLA
jgi:hypothetical protein